MEFGTVRDELGIADSVLSKQFRVLTDAGYATTSKAAAPTGRARTWLALTRGGRVPGATGRLSPVTSRRCANSPPPRRASRSPGARQSRVRASKARIAIGAMSTVRPTIHSSDESSGYCSGSAASGPTAGALPHNSRMA